MLDLRRVEVHGLLLLLLHSPERCYTRQAASPPPEWIAGGNDRACVVLGKGALVGVEFGREHSRVDVRVGINGEGVVES